MNQSDDSSHFSEALARYFCEEAPVKLGHTESPMTRARSSSLLT